MSGGSAMLWSWSLGQLLGCAPAALASDALPPQSVPEPALDPVALLQWVTARDGVRIEPMLLGERLAQACADGQALACALQPLDRGDPLQDRGAVAAALAPLCERGDAGACLGQAWALLPAAGSSVDARAAADPPRVRALFQRACQAGLQRACTELGTVHALGIGTYVGRLQAEERWAVACDAGEPHACTLLGGSLRDRAYLDEGLQGGDQAAWMVLADTFPKEREAALQRACEVGATAGCVALAEGWLDRGFEGEGTDLSQPRQVLDRACGLGDPVACAWVHRIDASEGQTSREHAASALDALCPTVPWACEQARFIEGGGPIHLRYPGRGLTPKDLSRDLFDRRDKIEGCAGEWLAREPMASGTAELVLQMESDGQVSGVHIARAPDPTHAQCVASLVRGLKMRAPEGGPGRFEVSFPVYHGADIKFDPLFPGEGGYDPGRLSLDTPAWAVAADRCLLTTVGPEPGIEMTLRFQALRDGRARAISVMESSEEPALDECMVGWLSQHRFIEPVALPLAAKVRVRFLRYRNAPIDTALDAPTLAQVQWATSAVEPTQVRLLALIAPRGELAVGGARMSRTARRSIERVHEELAAVVQEYTHGALVLETTLREVEGAVRSVRRVGDELAPEPWILRSDEIDRNLLAAIEPGRWDAVVVWVPTQGLPQAPTGVTLDSTTVRGATFSVLPVPGGRAVQPPHGLPAWELPLRALWRQALARADRLVGVELPLDTEVIEVDRHKLDPRAWADPPSHSVLGWYAHVLGTQVHPELWRALWRGPDHPHDGPRRVSANLAQQGRPTGEGVLHLEGLNDTIVDLGRFANLPTGDGEAPAISFGLEWREPVRFGMVVAHVGDRADSTRPSLRDPVLEVLGPDLQWAPLQARRQAEGSVIHFTFPPLEAYGVRIRVVDGAVAPVCRELEVR